MSQASFNSGLVKGGSREGCWTVSRTSLPAAPFSLSKRKDTPKPCVTVAERVWHLVWLNYA